MDYVRADETIGLFDRALSAALAIIYLSLLPDYSIYFGSQSQLQVPKIFNGVALPFYLDVLTYRPELGPLIVSLLLFACLAIVLGFSNPVFRIARAIALFWLHHGLWTVGDGGMNLAVLSCLYLCAYDLPLHSRVRSVINLNLLMLLKLQFVLIYVVAFISKLNGDLWVSGDALGYILQVDKFRSNFLLGIFTSVPVIEKILTQGVVLIQGLLPLLLVFRIPRFNLAGIALGIALHLGIAIHMGLVGFSLCMIVHYSLFFPSHWRSRVRRHLKPHWKLPAYVAAAVLLCTFAALSQYSKATSLQPISLVDPTNDPALGEDVDYASLSKLYTPALVDALLKDKSLNLSDRIRTESGTYNLKDLLTFTAGVRDKTINPELVTTFSWSKWSTYYANDSHEPRYSNFSYAIAQRLISTTVNRSYESLIDEKLNLRKQKIRPKPMVNNSETRGATLSLELYHPELLAAFGLIGPRGSLRTLAPFFTDQGFCIAKAEICHRGTMLPQGYYFSGSHGKGVNYLIFHNKKLYHMYSDDHSQTPESVFRRGA